MEGIIGLFSVVAVLGVLDLLAHRFGADSRPDYIDDWSRDAAS